MKPPLPTIVAVSVLMNFAAAMTVEEYAAKPPEEKIKVLRGKPERSLDDPRQLLRLYTISLRDPSPNVRQTAAQAAALLVMGLQSAQPSGNVPAFPSEDSAAFQQALVSMLNQDDPAIRASVASALANSAKPNAAIETQLLDRVRVEPVPEIKSAIMEAMAQAGYDSPRLVGEATALIQTSDDSKAIYAASKVLGHLHPESALDTLIALASKVSPSQQHALTALGAYGQAATRAVPALERLIGDQTMPEEMRNLAKITLEKIKAAQPQPSSLPAMKPVNLWPVSVAAASPATPTPEPSPASTTPAPASTPSSAPTTPAAQNHAPSIERKAPVWPWVAGIAALLVIVAFFAKRKN